MTAKNTDGRKPHPFSVAIAIPAFNEESSIVETLQRVRQVVADIPIFIIDDGSTDRTSELAESAGAIVLRHPYNKGNGAAAKTALRHIQTDKIVIIDADGQHPPELIPTFIDQLNHYDLIVGARSSESQSLFYRDVGNIMLKHLATYLSDYKIPDLTSGFRAFDRRKALEFIYLYPNGFSFPTTSTLAFISSGYNVTFHPIVAAMRKKGTHSKIRPIRDGLRFGLLIVRISTMINPLRVFFPAGFVTLLIGIAWTIRNVMVHGQFSVAGALFVTLGINILFFGIVVDQLAAIRLKTKS